MHVNSEILDRLPPHNLDAEKGVIGSILLDPRWVSDVADIVKPSDFYAEANAALFDAILVLDNRRTPVDPTLLLEHLRSSGKLELVGGAAHVAECLHATPYAAQACYYARIVRDKAILRGAIHAATETLREAYDGLTDPQAVLDAAEQRFREIGDRGEVEMQTAAELAVEVSDHIDSVVERGQSLGVPTGFLKFDEQAGGLFNGEFIILAARPSIGKSALAGQIVDYVSLGGRLVYFASLEMTGRESAMRSICTAASVDGRKIRTASLDDKDRKKLVDGMARYSQQNLIVDRRTELTVESLGRTIRRLIPKGLQLAVVDHLGLLKPSKQGKGVNRVEQISHQTRYFKLLAREVKIPILVLCQINRQQVQGVGRPQEAGRPQLHQLRESGSIEMDADTVLMIHRPDGGIADPVKSTKIHKVNLDWPAELIVAKQRNGQTTTIRLDWEPQYTRFSCWGCTQVDGEERSENYEPGFDNPPEGF